MNTDINLFEYNFSIRRLYETMRLLRSSDPSFVLMNVNESDRLTGVL